MPRDEPRRKHSQNFLTRLWQILPQLSSVINWSLSGEYLVVYDPCNLLKELQNHKVMRRSNPNSASLDRQLRLYGSNRVRPGALRTIPEFENVKLKTCVWKHKFLNRASTADHVRMALATLEQLRPEGKKKRDASEAGRSPAVAVQNAPTPDGVPDRLRELPSQQMAFGAPPSFSEGELSPYSAGSIQVDIAIPPHMLDVPAVCASSSTPYYQDTDGFYLEATDTGDHLTSEDDARLDALLAEVLRSEETSARSEYSESAGVIAMPQDTTWCASPAGFTTVDSTIDHPASYLAVGPPDHVYRDLSTYDYDQMPFWQPADDSDRERIDVDAWAS